MGPRRTSGNANAVTRAVARDPPLVITRMRGRRGDDDGDGTDDGGVCADGDDEGGNGDGGDDEHRDDGVDGARAHGRICASPAFLESRARF